MKRTLPLLILLASMVLPVRILANAPPTWIPANSGANATGKLIEQIELLSQQIVVDQIEARGGDNFTSMRVTDRFILHNTGGKTVQMDLGFSLLADYQDTDGTLERLFSEIIVTVDEEPVTVEKQKTKANERGFNIGMKFRVELAPRQSRTVVVVQPVWEKPKTNPQSPYAQFRYDLSGSFLWKGPIKKLDAWIHLPFYATEFNAGGTLFAQKETQNLGNTLVFLTTNLEMTESLKTQPFLHLKIATAPASAQLEKLQKELAEDPNNATSIANVAGMLVYCDACQQTYQKLVSQLIEAVLPDIPQPRKDLLAKLWTRLQTNSHHDVACGCSKEVCREKEDITKLEIAVGHIKSAAEFNTCCCDGKGIDTDITALDTAAPSPDSETSPLSKEEHSDTAQSTKRDRSSDSKTDDKASGSGETPKTKISPKNEPAAPPEDDASLLYIGAVLFNILAIVLLLFWNEKRKRSKKPKKPKNRY